MPTLIDGDTAIWEFNTIFVIGGKNSSQLYPATRHGAPMSSVGWNWLLASLNAPYLGLSREAKKAANDRAPSWAADAKEMIANLQLLDGQLARHPYIAGEALSIADIALAPIVARCTSFPIELTGSAKSQGLAGKKIASRPAFKKATAA